MLEKQGQTHKVLTNEDLHTSALYGHWMPIRGPAKSDDDKRESKT